MSFAVILGAQANTLNKGHGSCSASFYGVCLEVFTRRIHPFLYSLEKRDFQLRKNFQHEHVVISHKINAARHYKQDKSHDAHVPHEFRHCLCGSAVRKTDSSCCQQVVCFAALSPAAVTASCIPLPDSYNRNLTLVHPFTTTQ
ncbi:unnamed protein product [Ectocarpus sp. 13 AM-2016]